MVVPAGMLARPMPSSQVKEIEISWHQDAETSPSVKSMEYVLQISILPYSLDLSKNSTSAPSVTADG